MPYIKINGKGACIAPQAANEALRYAAWDQYIDNSCEFATVAEAEPYVGLLRQFYPGDNIEIVPGHCPYYGEDIDPPP